MNTKITKFLVVVSLFGLLLCGQAFAYKYVVNGNATYSYVVPTTQVTALEIGTTDTLTTLFQETLSFTSTGGKLPI